MKKLSLGFVIPVICILFFWQVFVRGLLPIPADTIVGLYYPFRDIYSKTNPNGTPFKNFLITDPVRQQYPWKELSVSIIKKWEIPVWNPYNSAGTPLLANFQSGVLYPLNILFFVLPFSIAWTILIILQPVLAGLFLFFYLRNLKLGSLPSLLGSLVFSFSGFSIAWLEWGTVIHTALWLPLIMISADKLFEGLNKNKIKPIWALVFVFSCCSSFFAGHLQTFFYVFLFSLVHLVSKFIVDGKRLKTLCVYLVLGVCIALITAVQWIPTLRFIVLSARDLDVAGFTSSGWFIPWQNVIQFVVPDFFGNPTTLNYWGEWNYGEFIGYTSIFPLLLALYALVFKKDKKTFFFGAAFFMSLIMAFPTVFAKLPFELDIPFISTAQPTRLMFVADFSLSILAAIGLDYFIMSKAKKNIIYILAGLMVIFISMWGLVLFTKGSPMLTDQLSVSRQNLILPTAIFAFITVVLGIIVVIAKSKSFRWAMRYAIVLLLILTVADLFRFGWKFIPLTKKEYLFPQTSITSFLEKQKNSEPFRVMSLDSRIMPPNFSTMYRIEMLDGYDPLYLRRYGELAAAIGRQKPDIQPPFGFNRIISPQNHSSPLVDLLNVKFLLSLNELSDSKLTEVYRDGSVYVYENKQVTPRAFFAENVILSSSKQESIDALFKTGSLKGLAVVESEGDKALQGSQWGRGDVAFLKRTPNKTLLKVNAEGAGFLVLSDSYYPTWHAKIDGKETKIYLTNYNFRGILVPDGEHEVEFYTTLL